MKCVIKQENCIACGLCQVVAPTLFDYNDEGIVIFAQNPASTNMRITDLDRNSCKQAMKSCPVDTITIESVD